MSNCHQPFHGAEMEKDSKAMQGLMCAGEGFSVHG